MTAPAVPRLDELALRAAAIADGGWPIGPRPMPCTCGADWHDHFRAPFPAALPKGCGGYQRDPADALAEQALEDSARGVVQDLIEHGNAEHERKRRQRPPGPRVSDAGACRRQVWYRECPPDGYVPAPTDQRAAAMGAAIHEAVARARATRYPWRMHEFELPIPGLDSLGKPDEYDPVTGEVHDDKTAGEYKWELVGEDGPTSEAWEQGMIYGYALECLGFPVRTVRITVIRRSTGAEEPFVRPYDPAVALEALDNLTELATMLEVGVAPPRDGYGLKDWRCGFCEARLHCWNVDAARAAGRSPESYTVLGEEPAHPAVAWAAERAYTLAKQATELEKQAKAAKVLLDGIKPGVYGEWKIGQSSRQMPEYKATHTRNLAWLALPEEVRPGFEEFAAPEKRTDRYPTVSRVRAAKRGKSERT